MGIIGADTYNKNPDTKICTHCLIEKPLDSFSRHPTAGKKRKQVCKPCDHAYSMKNYERKLALRGKTRCTFVGGLVDKCDFKRGDVRDDGLIFHSKRKKPDGRFQEWWMTREDFERRVQEQLNKLKWRYHNDPDYREKERQQNTSERQRAAKRRWNHANKIRQENYMAMRRAKIKGHKEQMTHEENQRALDFYRFRDILNSVHGCVMFNVDHTTPIARGGRHHPDNLRVTTAKFNHVKFVNQLCPATHRKIA